MDKPLGLPKPVRLPDNLKMQNQTLLASTNHKAIRDDGDVARDETQLLNKDNTQVFVRE